MGATIHNESVFSVRIPSGVLAEVDRLVKDGHALNRADFIRGAIYNRLKA